MSRITVLTAADRDEWLPLWQSYLTFYEEELPSEVTDDTFLRLVAGDGVHGAIARDDDGRAIGIAHWLFHPSTWSPDPSCYLNDLFVAPDARARGTGAALIAHVRAEAEAPGAHDVYWITQEGNRTARALYDRVAKHTGFVHYEITL